MKQELLWLHQTGNRQPDIIYKKEAHKQERDGYF